MESGGIGQSVRELQISIKKICERHFSKQNVKIIIMSRFIINIFHDKNEFIEYLRSGATRLNPE